jgi:predicted RecB family nuclease
MSDAPGTPAPLGAYAARSCAVRTQWDVLVPAEPAPDTDFQRMLAAQGQAFEAQILAELAAAHPGAVDAADDEDPDQREARTRAAMRAGAPLVLHPRLPADVAGGRVGEPDLLVRLGPAAPHDGVPRYVPVDVKSHRVIGTADPADPAYLVGVQPLPMLDATAARPRPREAATADGVGDDLLQLAHYRRMLEACGHAADVALAALIGREGQAVWFDLDEPRFLSADGADAGRRSALAHYDAAFAERHRVAAAAAAHRADPSVALPLAPVRISECPQCRWRVHCGALLEARQDVSLLPRVGRAGWEALERVGATTIDALAALDDTAVVEGFTAGALAELIEQARARSGPAPAYRRRGIAQVRVDTGEVELDVDMENVEDGAYLWGVWVTDRSASGVVRPGYHAFMDWSADAALAGRRAFEDFWTWLDQVRHDVAEHGLTLRAYCWSEAAENRWLRVGGAAIDRAEEVEAFIRSDEWIDLLRVFTSQTVTGRSGGLKVVAPLLGFAWEDDDAGGTQSMTWWQGAVDPSTPPARQEQLRRRILAYNRDDVRATLHVRDWLVREGPDLQPVPQGPLRASGRGTSQR